MLPRLRSTLVPWMIAFASLFIFTLAPHTAAAHNDDAYYADTGNLPDQSRWMARVPDATHVTHMSIPGTHDSGSRFGTDPVTTLVTKTQSLTITQQLKGGIRFLDVRLRHIDNVLAVHHGAVYQNAMFGSVFKEVTDFLGANPTETVLMRVKQEHTEQNTTRSFAQTFRTYYEGNERWFATPPGRSRNYGDPTLGEVRGKIVLLVDFPDAHIHDIGWHYRSTFYRVQDDYALSAKRDLYAKWLKVKAALGGAQQFRSHSINYLSGSTGGVLIYPYFVASGHISMGTGAARLATGYTTPGFTDTWPDFPRVDCFIGICTIAYEGTNTLTKDWINRVQPSYVGLVVADFPGAGLIKSVIDTNFRKVPLLSEANGLCLDIAHGVSQGHPLGTHPCHGGDNQGFRFSGEQILVGSQCLDVAGGRNVNRAAVIAYPCHGGENQKWRHNADGSIQSLLAGPARCLDVAIERGGVVELLDCRPSSSRQHFWEKTRFPTQLLVNESNDQCADIRGGVGKNHALVTWACKGSDNQKFKFDGEQLLVGGMCLDVRGNRNVHHAEVVSHPCNGQQNQKWRLNPNGTIQSLMPGEARCLDLATENANELRMRTCTTHPDQRFMRVPL